jgi:predicted acylesterase/phospholipase RssA
MKRVIKWAGRGLLTLVGIGLIFIVVGFLAPLKVHWSIAHDAAPEAPYGPDLSDAPFVGLALSGGGTRAALFGAAGMEALARRGHLGDVTHVSSVSGGGFPAAYMATHPVPDCPQVPAPEGAELDCFGEYFSAMRGAISPNYMTAIHIEQLTTPWRILQPSRRLTSLSEVLAEPRFLDGAQFSNITDQRGYFFNAVSYDTGQRFVFSNMALPYFGADGANLLPQSLRSLSFSTAGSAQPTPSTFDLSMAVATSAAFPPYLGPLSIEMPQAGDDPTLYRRLGDGGVLENSGVETLVEAYLVQPNATPAVIYSFNAGLPLDAATSQRNRDLSIFSVNLAQFVDVLLTYATAHREAHIAEFAAARGIEMDVMSFDYLDVAGIVAGGREGTWLEWDTWEACSAPARALAPTPVARLRTIPTSLNITACDAALITEAAEFVVGACLEARETEGCFAGR